MDPVAGAINGHYSRRTRGAGIHPLQSSPMFLISVTGFSKSREKLRKRLIERFIDSIDDLHQKLFF